MSARLLSFRPSQVELEAAWCAFDERRRELEAMYREDRGTVLERMNVALECNRLHRQFAALCSRMDAGR